MQGGKEKKEKKKSFRKTRATEIERIRDRREACDYSFVGQKSMEILKVAKYLQLFFFLLFRKVSKASFFLIFALAPPPQKHSNAVPSCTVRKLGNCRTGEREGTSDHRVKRRWKTRKERFLQKARQQ